MGPNIQYAKIGVSTSIFIVAYEQMKQSEWGTSAGIKYNNYSVYFAGYQSR